MNLYKIQCYIYTKRKGKFELADTGGSLYFSNEDEAGIVILKCNDCQGLLSVLRRPHLRDTFAYSYITYHETIKAYAINGLWRRPWKENRHDERDWYVTIDIKEAEGLTINDVLNLRPMQSAIEYLKERGFDPSYIRKD